jgi:hypothetical protein
MPENAEDTVGTTVEQHDEDKQPEVERSFSQDEVNKLIEKRLYRERGKFSDYDELKEKASKAESVETDLQTALKRAEEAESKLKGFETAKQLSEWKTQVSKDTGVPAEVLEGSTLEEIQAHAERIQANADKIHPIGLKIPGIGDQPEHHRPLGKGADFIESLNRLGF